MTAYDDFYAKGGFKYQENKAIPFIERNTNLPKIFQDKGFTLLDYCMGDGFWSKVLSRWCLPENITGIELSEKGVEIAKSNLPKANFICCSALDYNNKHDVVFSRAAGVFNCEIDSEKFKMNIKQAVSLANKYFYFMEFTKPELYNVFNGRWHHKNPVEVQKELSQYGQTTNLSAENNVIIEVKI
jgi:phospholipid N-methyltransferase